MTTYRLNVLSALLASTAGYRPPPNASIPALPSTQLYTPHIPGIAVVGKPSGYTMPAAFTGAVAGQQWYRNKGDGTGPVAIAGATGATYAPVSADVGYWLSVWVTDAGGNVWRSLEFINQATPVGNSGVINAPSNIGYQQNATVLGVRDPLTVYGVATIRITDQTHAGYYIDNYLAPGTYAAYTGPTTYQESVLFAATGGSGDYNTSLKYVVAPGPRSIVAQTPAPTTTAARPSGNTGNGFYVAANGYIYDPIGNEFRPRGVNQLHWNSGSPGIPNSGANIVRFWMDMTQSDHNLGVINNNLIAHQIVPMLLPPSAYANFTATFSGTVMTVTAMSAGALAGSIMVGQSVLVNDGTTGFLACTIVSAGTGTGGVGTYNLSVSQTVTGPSLMRQSGGTTGSSDPRIVQSIVNTLCANVGIYASIMKYIMLNPVNEWGPQGQDAGGSNTAVAAGANTVWRDAWVSAIPQLRTAGWTCPIVIDGPGNGQDGANCWTLLNHGPAIVAADPFKSIILSDHVYGATKPGRFADVAAQLSACRATYGLAFVIGEFDQGMVNVDAASGYTTGLEVMGTCEAFNFGWLAWCWDTSYLGSAPAADTGTYALVYTYNTGYQASNPTDLTIWGKTVVLDPVYGLSVIAQKATAGSFT